MWWFQIGTCCLPVALVIWSCAAFAISFLIAVLSRHVPPLVPFISDTGTQPPERCIFGLMINFSAFLGLVVMYIRYKLLKTLNERTQIINLRLNTAALICGALGCLGMCIVANFQETALRIVHDIGALLAFVMGTMYLILQSYISFKMMPCHHTSLVCGFRIMLSTVSAVATIPMIVCYFLSNNSTLDLTPEDKGYAYHVTSAVCEWLVAFSFNFFFLTYIKEFQIPYILRDSLQHLEDEVQQLSRLPLIVHEITFPSKPHINVTWNQTSGGLSMSQGQPCSSAPPPQGQLGMGNAYIA